MLAVGEPLCLSLHSATAYHVVCFLLGNSPASEFYVPTFRNALSVPSSWTGEVKQSNYRPGQTQRVPGS